MECNNCRKNFKRARPEKHRDMYVYIPGLSNGANGSSDSGERLHRERLVIRRTIKQAQKKENYKNTKIKAGRKRKQPNLFALFLSVSFRLERRVGQQLRSWEQLFRRRIAAISVTSCRSSSESVVCDEISPFLRSAAFLAKKKRKEKEKGKTEELKVSLRNILSISARTIWAYKTYL